MSASGRVAQRARLTVSPRLRLLSCREGLVLGVAVGAVVFENVRKERQSAADKAVKDAKLKAERAKLARRFEDAEARIYCLERLHEKELRRLAERDAATAAAAATKATSPAGP